VPIKNYYTHQIPGGTYDTHEYIYCYNLVFLCCMPAFLWHCFRLIGLSFKQPLLLFYDDCRIHIFLIRFVAFNSIYKLFYLCFMQYWLSLLCVSLQFVTCLYCMVSFLHRCQLSGDVFCTLLTNFWFSCRFVYFPCNDTKTES